MEAEHNPLPHYVNGVQLYQETNKDIGATTAHSDENVAAGDGFETLIFDTGLGEDIDAAWVRISPDSPVTVAVHQMVGLETSSDQVIFRVKPAI